MVNYVQILLNPIQYMKNYSLLVDAINELIVSNKALSSKIPQDLKEDFNYGVEMIGDFKGMGYFNLLTISSFEPDVIRKETHKLMEVFINLITINTSLKNKLQKISDEEANDLSLLTAIAGFVVGPAPAGPAPAGAPVVPFVELYPTHADYVIALRTFTNPVGVKSLSDVVVEITRAVNIVDQNKHLYGNVFVAAGAANNITFSMLYNAQLDLGRNEPGNKANGETIQQARSDLINYIMLLFRVLIYTLYNQRVANPHSLDLLLHTNTIIPVDAARLAWLNGVSIADYIRELFIANPVIAGRSVNITINPVNLPLGARNIAPIARIRAIAIGGAAKNLSNYKDKYLKYKDKYLKLKQKLNL